MSGETPQSFAVPTLKAVGARVKQAVKESGLPYERVAADCGFSLSHLHKIIAGTADAKALEIWRIARRTDKPFSWFAGEQPQTREQLVAEVLRLHGAVAQLSDMAADIGQELRRAIDRLDAVVDESEVDVAVDAAVAGRQKAR